jgi:hypothetical protein
LLFLFASINMKFTVNLMIGATMINSDSYHKILDMLDLLEAVEGIKSGLESMEHGKSHPAYEVLQRIAYKFKIPVDK